MDRTPLFPLVERLRADERLPALAASLPTRVRVAEPVVGLLVAALHTELGRPLSVLVPEDADARDLAEAISWFVGPDRVGLFPSRGVSAASGLAPAPHLVGERARALTLLHAGGVVCVSALALAELGPPPVARPRALGLAAGESPGIDGLARNLADAGYARVERVEERGQFAVRGGLVDVFPATGREPLRIDFFGDQIEAIRAFSPYTQRTLAEVSEAVVYPASEWRADLVDPMLPDERGDEAAGPQPVVAGLVPAFGAPVDLVWSAAEVRTVWREEGLAEIALEGVSELDPLPAGQTYSFEAQRPALAARGLSEAENELLGLQRQGLDVVVAFAHRGEAERQRQLLRRVEVSLPGPGTSPEGVVFVVTPARRGFVWRELGIALLPDTQVFRRRAPRTAVPVGRALASFSDLRSGDYVVHEDHGIAQLLGFETREVGGVTRDYLLLAFRGDDRVYVPHEQIGKVSRYVGASQGAPVLSKLGGSAWANLKNRARVHLQEMAGELLALYAQRQTRPGIAYDVEGEWLAKLEADFPYRETADQARAIEAVKEDLEAPHPMDRLICGDVGFGKTEVALRAAFAVASSGRQVLMLVPTTVLAQQHWNSFRERCAEFPIRVEMVSRFRSAAEVKRVLADFRAGKVEILIGTHRALSRDVVPAELGLVIIDEEQRFGVAQKEFLRQLRLEVDVLAMSATPIPRSLHMSLSGLRDISVIETPPDGRLPIRTHVGEYDAELVVSAIERELERGGQAFYLHNRVETIDEAAEKLRQLCPDARILVAHGQMPERDLEERMLRFLAGDADVLVSTTIIESGLDIPQANTLIVERADTLGLAQLYQIRGRVGRSDLTAHAYLFYPEASELSPDARTRLATVADHTELGSGFAIAMRDLEIRGAGDLLGAEQSGHVAALGFELYVEMLHEVIAELSGAVRPLPRPVRVEARVDAYVPAGYIASEALKIDLHRRLALVSDEDDLAELRAATEDRYGPPPEPVENLFAIAALKLGLSALGADYLLLRGGRVSVGRVVLGSGELRELRARVPTVVYAGASSEVTLRCEELVGAVGLVDAMLAARRAA